MTTELKRDLARLRFELLMQYGCNSPEYQVFDACMQRVGCLESRLEALEAQFAELLLERRAS